MVIIDKEKLRKLINENKIIKKQREDVKIGDRIIGTNGIHYSTIFKVENIVPHYKFNKWGDEYLDSYELLGQPKITDADFSHNTFVSSSICVIIDENIKDEDLIADDIEEVFFNIFYNDKYVGKTFGIILSKDFDINKITIKKKD